MVDRGASSLVLAIPLRVLELDLLLLQARLAQDARARALRGERVAARRGWVVAVAGSGIGVVEAGGVDVAVVAVPLLVAAARVGL